MTREERNNKLKYLITCMKCEVSGKCCDENCPTQYNAGNMGEIIENLEEISKILEKEPCEDAISRQAVVEYIKASDADLGHDSENEFAVEDILNMPPVTPTQKWIPVSERLPNIGETVLCQCQANIYEVLKLTVDGWYHDNEHCYMEGFVIAWQPLPQPYKAESEDKE